MKPTMPMTLLTVMSMLALVACGLTDKSASGNGTTTEAENALSLRVVNQDRTPAMGARVTLCAGAVACTNPTRETQTDVAGAARMDSLADGEYYLSISLDTLMEGVAVMVSGGGEHDLGIYTLDGVAEPTVVGNLLVGNWLNTWSDGAEVELWSMVLGDHGQASSCRWNYPVGGVPGDSACIQTSWEDLGLLSGILPINSNLIELGDSLAPELHLGSAHVVYSPMPDSIPFGGRWQEGWLLASAGDSMVYSGDVQIWEWQGDTLPGNSLVGAWWNHVNGTDAMRFMNDGSLLAYQDVQMYAGAWLVDSVGRLAITLTDSTSGDNIMSTTQYYGVSGTRLMIFDMEDPAVFVSR